MNMFDYGKAVPKGEGVAVGIEKPMTPTEKIAFLKETIHSLQRYRAVGLRLRTIAKEGNLMINHPDKGFVLVEDLEQYMMERL
jgi:hypothetical protein